MVFVRVINFVSIPVSLSFSSQLVTRVSSAIPRLQLNTGIRWAKAVCIHTTSCRWLSVLCILPQCLSLPIIPELTETIQTHFSSPRLERTCCIYHSSPSVSPVLVWCVGMLHLRVFLCSLCQGITVVTLHTSFCMDVASSVCLPVGAWCVCIWEREREKQGEERCWMFKDYDV